MAEAALPLRIAVVSPGINKHSGTELCVASFVERAARIAEVTVFSHRIENTSLDHVRQMYRIPVLPGPAALRWASFLLFNSAFRWLLRVFRGQQYDLVVSAGADCFRANLVISEFCTARYRQDLMQDPIYRAASSVLARLRYWHRRLYARLVAAVERHLYVGAHARYVVCPSHLHREELIRFYGVDPSRIFVNPTGVDPDRFHPARRLAERPRTRAAFGFSESEVVILFIAGDWERKGMPYLLRALTRLRRPAARLLAVGPPPTFKAYRSLLDGLGVRERVRFVPASPAVGRFYAAADLVVAPSLYDTFNFVPLEAMATGLPVVVSVEAGASELIQDGVDGLLIRNPRDPEEVAGHLRRLLDDPALRRRLGEAGRETALRYTWDHWFEGFVKPLKDFAGLA